MDKCRLGNACDICAYNMRDVVKICAKYVLRIACCAVGSHICGISCRWGYEGWFGHGMVGDRERGRNNDDIVPTPNPDLLGRVRVRAGPRPGRHQSRQGRVGRPVVGGGGVSTPAHIPPKALKEEEAGTKMGTGPKDSHSEIREGWGIQTPQHFP